MKQFRIIPLWWGDHSKLCVKLRLGRADVTFFVDTGALRSFITTEDLMNCGLVKLVEFGYLRDTKLFGPTEVMITTDLKVTDSGYNILGLDVLKEYKMTLNTSSKSPYLYINSLNNKPIDNVNEDLWMVDVDISGHKVKAMLDTGAPCSTMAQDLAQQCGLNVASCPQVYLHYPMRSRFYCLTQQAQNVSFTSKGLSSTTDVYLAKDFHFQLQLGMDVLKDQELRPCQTLFDKFLMIFKRQVNLS